MIPAINKKGRYISVAALDTELRQNSVVPVSGLVNQNTLTFSKPQCGVIPQDSVELLLIG